MYFGLFWQNLFQLQDFHESTYYSHVWTCRILIFVIGTFCCFCLVIIDLQHIKILAETVDGFHFSARNLHRPSFLVLFRRSDVEDLGVFSFKHHLVSMHTHSDNIFGDKRHLKHTEVLSREPRYPCGGYFSFLIYRRYFRKLFEYILKKKKTLFGKILFWSPVQKYITKKVQAYFKHLCALKLNFRSKKIDMSVYNQNLPYSIFL